MYGEISRISREAPVLVLNQRETQLVPGGGANAIHNLRTLGRKAPFRSVSSATMPRAINCSSTSSNSISIASRVSSVARAYRTPTEDAAILAGAVHSHHQQIVRLDSGGPSIDGRAQAGVEHRLRRALRGADALLVSDYGYGLVDPKTVARCRKPSIPTTIDSRFNLDQYLRPSRRLRPNEPEVEAALGGISIGNDLAKLEWAGRNLLRKLKHAALLITRGKDGMALFERGKEPTLHIPIPVEPTRSRTLPARATP